MRALISSHARARTYSQTHPQKLFGVHMATFKPKIIAYWTGGEFTDCEGEDEAGDE